MERLMEGRWCVCTKTSAHEGVAWCVGGWVTPRRLGDSWLWEEQTVILFAEKVTVRRGSWLQKKKVMDLVLPYWFEAFVGYPRRDGWKIAGHLSPELKREIWAGERQGGSSLYDDGWLSESESEVAQSCLTLCDPVDCSLPGSSLHGILQARVLEWVAMPFSRGSSQPWVSCIAGRHFNLWATREAQRIVLFSWDVLGVGGSPAVIPGWAEEERKAK